MGKNGKSINACNNSIWLHVATDNVFVRIEHSVNFSCGFKQGLRVEADNAQVNWKVEAEAQNKRVNWWKPRRKLKVKEVRDGNLGGSSK